MSRTHAQQRGAAVFVVVMAITLLTAVGMFAAHSATLVDQASGYARLGRQTRNIAEYGTLATAAELGSGAAEPYVRQMAARTDSCRANAGLEAPCYKVFYAALDGRTSSLSDESLIEVTDEDNPGSLGLNASSPSGVVGDFVVELTDPGPSGALVAGVDQGGGGASFRYLRVTATGIAQIRPPGDSCTDAISTLTGQQSVRAHLLLGPIQE